MNDKCEQATEIQTIDDYREQFGLNSEDKEKAKMALEKALDIRKFEIELYWKRTNYFWVLIAACFTGYFSVSNSSVSDEKCFYLFVLSCIGLVFSWAWVLVNRGSKFWQENWENHVDLLENEIMGPLYKTVVHNHRVCFLENFFTFTEQLPVSVSKVNQCCSVFVLLVWIVLLCRAIPINFIYAGINFCKLYGAYVLVFVFAASIVVRMYWKGRTNYNGGSQELRSIIVTNRRSCIGQKDKT